MIVLDANILLYAYDTQAPQHTEARIWLERALSGDELIGLPWQTIGAFLRIVTHPRLPGRRFGLQEAAAVVDAWLAQPNVQLVIQGRQHWPLLRRTAIDAQAHGGLMTDAQLAALTIEAGGVLCTTDRDFRRFDGLRTMNPLAGPESPG